MTDSRTKTILIAEDSPVQAELLKRLLLSEGYNVSLAKDGLKALEAANAHPPDLIISDILMPEMDGYELCQKLKSSDLFKNTAVVLLTRLAGVKEIATALNTQADAYISKPYNENNLLKVISSLLSGKERLQIGVKDQKVEIIEEGEKYELKADMEQLIKLLISTYENTVEQNRELLETQNELKALNKTLNQKAREKADELKASEESLVESEIRYSSLVETAKDAIITIDTNGAIVSWNQFAETIFGYSYEELKEKQLSMIIPDKYLNSHNKGIKRAASGTASKLIGKTIEIEGKRADGVEIPIELSLSKWQSKGENYFTAIIRDISKRMHSRDELRRNYQIQSIINSILQVSLEPITLFEQLGKILDLLITIPWFEIEAKGSIFLKVRKSRRLELTVQRGLHKELLVKCRNIPFGKCLCGQSALTGEVVFKNHMDQHHEITFEGITPHGHYCVPIKSRKKVLGVINLYVKAGHVRTQPEEDFLNTVANTIAGIIERKRSEEKLEYLANFDTLTGLPNRILFFDRLNQTIRHSRRYNEIFALLYLDLDNFKCINDTMGHDTGDMLLKEVSERLSDCIRQTDTVARMSGDEFTIVMTNIKKPEEATSIAQKIINRINIPYKLGNISCSVTSSIGISIYPQDGEESSTLIKNADIAMYQAKANVGNGYRFFSVEMNTAITERVEMESSLRRALEQEEFTLYYQPQVDLLTGKIIGMEALIRWIDPEKGVIQPDRFIPLAEETCLIIPIGEWVLEAACKDNKELQKEYIPHIRVAVNMSLCQFIRQENLNERVAQILFEAGLSPQYLELELTESICMENVENTINTLKEFASMGVELSIDDFGTGYSSLSYLKHMPINKLKIDKSFITNLAKDSDDIALVTTIISMAHNLNMKVIAEGVETVEQLKLLNDLKCDEIQGYLFSKPVPMEEFKELLKEKNIFHSILAHLK